MGWWLKRSFVSADSGVMAASPRQRRKAAAVLRAGGTQEDARKVAGVKSVSTIKRWLKEPAFQAMVRGSPDIRAGSPPRVDRSPMGQASEGDERLQMWVVADCGEEGPKVLGRHIAPDAYEDPAAVVHVHVVQLDASVGAAASIAAGEFPDESPYVPVSLAGLDGLLDNLPLVCRLGSADQRESLMAWFEVWTFIDEEGRTRTLGEALWDGQRRFLDALLCEGHVVSIKSRKVGLTTLVCAHAAWTARIRDVNASVQLISHREDAARDLLGSLRRGFDGLPAFLRLPLARQTATVLSYAAGAGDTRSLKAYPATSRAAIEATGSHLVLDEWAHTFDPAAIWAAVEPTLPARATSALITTALAPGDFVHDYYSRSEAGETRHTAVFVSVLERPDRSEAWREQKQREQGKLTAMRNYPLTVDEAFAAAGEPYFDGEPLLEAQRDAIAPDSVRGGDRCLKAWDIGRKGPSVCVVLRASEDAAQVLDVVAYKRLVDQDYPTIQREIERMHRLYPGPTIVEANSIGKAVIENLRLPDGEVIEYTTTRVSKQQMLTAIVFHLQQRTLKIHPGFDQLLSELTAYRDPEGSIIQDSVMALGIAVANTDFAHAQSSGSESVLDLEPFTDDWYQWYEVRRLRSNEDLLNDNDARRDIIPPRERRARERAGTLPS
jgi:hypothetical protein